MLNLAIIWLDGLVGDERLETGGGLRCAKTKD